MNTKPKNIYNTNCSFLNLGFDILSQIFVEAQNPNLGTVSKLLYEISHTTSVQVEYIVLKIKDQWSFHRFFNKKMKLWRKSTLALGLVNKNIESYVYDRIFNLAIKKNYREIIRMLLSKSRISKIGYRYSEFDKLYTIEPLVDINNLYYSGDEEIFKMVENAHLIQIDVEKDFDIPKRLLGDQKKCQIHAKLDRNRYMIFLKGFIKSGNYEMIDYILNLLVLDQNDFGTCLTVAITSESIQMVYYFLEIGKKNQFALLDYTNQYRMENSDPSLNLEHLTGNIEDYPEYMRVLLRMCINLNRPNITLYFIEKGVKVEHEYIDIGRAFSNFKVLTVLIKSFGWENLSMSTKKWAVTSGNIQFLNELVDMGIDIHFDNDRLLRYSAGLDYNFLKRLLDLGANVYAGNSKYMKILLKSDLNKFKLVLKYARKPLANTVELFNQACLMGNLEISKVLLELNPDIIFNVKDLAYKLGIMGKLKCMELLLDRGIVLKDGKKLMTHAITANKRKLVKTLLKYNVPIKYESKNLFWIVCNFRMYKVVEMFMENANMKRTAIEHQFVFACRTNHIEVLYIILECSSALERKELLNLDNGLPLSLLARCGKKKAVTLFLNHGVIVNFKNKKLFLNSCRFGLENLIFLFLGNWKAKRNIKIINKGIILAIQNHHKVLSILLQYCIESKYKILFQNTLDQLLESCCRMGNLSFVKNVLELGANINTLGIEILKTVYNSRNQKLLDLLFSNGLKDKLKYLHFFKACEDGDFDKIKALVYCGIDINVCDSFGLSLACKTGNLEIVMFLIDKGSKLIKYHQESVVDIFLGNYFD
ncbi:hypothetical protein BB559_001397 [Furculomyces boomerangus]|uniref:Ankyrin repeat protein n=1 Tax=Furculomyces boomerangus TaxID=61424 RepID=A0A2T9Z250_9FUNG|nr:hypothetical protein BB559_001397 [Furculomyces boomerangus]